jgi:hypothetical protein
MCAHAKHGEDHDESESESEAQTKSRIGREQATQGDH